MEKDEKYFYCSFNNKRIAGVCGGLSHYYRVNSTVVRALFLSVCFLGIGLIIYAYLATYPPVITSESK